MKTVLPGTARNDSPRLRLGILGVVAVSLFVALFGRLWFLQVLTAPQYQLTAEANRQQVVSIPAPRGQILDRNGVPLVTNRASNVVSIARSRLADEDRGPLLRRLSVVLAKPVDELAAALEDERANRYMAIPVAEDVSEDVMTYLLERKEDFPAVRAERVAVRSYPGGRTAAQVLGYVGEINDRELRERGAEYQLGDLVGKDGIERMYEDDLKGIDGELRIEVDADGNPGRVLGRRPPVQGDDVVLSIDAETQRVAEESLDAGLARARGRGDRDDGSRRYVADAGSVVVLDANAGTVVAMASYPFFDPTPLVNGVSEAEYDFLFGEGTGAPAVNRAVSGQYAPGSTWKLVTALAGLQRQLIVPATTYNDTGTYRIRGCRGRCIVRSPGPTGNVDLREAITKSSDVYFYKMGDDFWNERGRFGETPIQDTGRSLGFGVETGVSLPTEADGRVPTPASRARDHEENPALEAGWYAGDSVNLSIGQGDLNVTPIQLANAYAALANGGTLYAPNLVLRVQDQAGAVIREEPPRVASQVDIPAQFRDPLRAGFAGVTQEGGTAAGAFLGWPHDRFPVEGKTGTAQASPKQDTSLFTAIMPANGTQYAAAVVMEQSGFGGVAAAPVARSVLAQLGSVPETAPAPSEIGGVRE